ALRDAGKQAVGATVYVNLEPCNHYGRTPPCTQALIAAKVRKVVVGMVDPNPLVCGRGIAALRDAGIEVVVGVEEGACRRLNEAFVHRVVQQRPFGILKYAMTLDGKIATTTGHSAWVTGTESRRWVHQQRAIADAVIVGGNTVRRDNPMLTTHGVGDREPLRVVMSRRCDLPPKANLWDVQVAPTVVFTETQQNPALQQTLQQQGVEVIAFPRLTPDLVMENLYQRGFSQVFWECGGVLAAAALQSGVIQKVMAFIAPKIIGGQTAFSPVSDLNITRMEEALVLKDVEMRQIGDDFLIVGYL
ncbi:MAG: bifunctional diaminohydroxyphosphoribosylaminopyrimidine deaminase/5-amino-6-(5-phosphoribosylamino)uracil reductase RibD, partial [Jaaginema sp. PMC 1078.18]|nr:bifunctional diaminohydroxyphosphoribosylaminopyrimidine deaminase/5-amino-6-(5-phosphoribosylamino)uracil reductase RibD [Jaaginema sp. PMC 1078.18]